MSASVLPEVLSNSTPSNPKGSIKDEQTRERWVEELLYDLMLFPNYKGYALLKEAILMLASDVSLGGSLWSRVYPAIAEKHGLKPQTVNKNIQFAVDKICANNSQETLVRILGESILNVPRLTSAKFISICAARARLG